MSITIKMARAKISASQDRMAHDLGVSRVTYRSWETGAAKIPGIYLQRLAELTGVNAQDIFLEEPTKNNSQADAEPDKGGD